MASSDNNVFFGALNTLLPRQVLKDKAYYTNRILTFKLTFDNRQTFFFKWSYDKWIFDILNKKVPHDERVSQSQFVEYMFDTNIDNKCDDIIRNVSREKKRYLHRIYQMCMLYDDKVPHNLNPIKFQKVQFQRA